MENSDIQQVKDRFKRYTNNDFELNIMDSIKEYTLTFNGATISEGVYEEVQDNSSKPVPYILIDEKFFWLEIGSKKVIVNWL